MSKDLFANMDEPSFTRRKFPQLEEEKREAELIEQAKENNNLITLPITQLVMDPDNESIFGKIELGSIVNFSSEIEHNGFKGAIMAYPIDTDDGKKYQIESGHRRFLAAKEAGLEELPVIVTEPPLSDTERKIRLIDMNMQNRDLKPSVLANVASVLLDNITAEEEKDGVPAKKRFSLWACCQKNEYFSEDDIQISVLEQIDSQTQRICRRRGVLDSFNTGSEIAGRQARINSTGHIKRISRKSSRKYNKTLDYFFNRKDIWTNRRAKVKDYSKKQERCKDYFQMCKGF